MEVDVAEEAKEEVRLMLWHDASLPDRLVMHDNFPHQRKMNPCDAWPKQFLKTIRICDLGPDKTGFERQKFSQSRGFIQPPSTRGSDNDRTGNFVAVGGIFVPTFSFHQQLHLPTQVESRDDESPLIPHSVSPSQIQWLCRSPHQPTPDPLSKRVVFTRSQSLVLCDGCSFIFEGGVQRGEIFGKQSMTPVGDAVGNRDQGVNTVQRTKNS